MAYTISDFLALEALRSANPRLISAVAQSSREISWVHVTELHDVAAVLSGGEMVLTTGNFLIPGDDRGLAEFVDRLAAADAGGLTLELGRNFSKVPATLAELGNRAGLPIIVLAHPVRFVEITQQVHARILNDQHESLRFSHTVHEMFHRLSLEGASTQEILDAACDLGGCSMILEDLGHRVIGYRTHGLGLRESLANWEQRSRQHLRPSAEWVSAEVGTEAQRWARLIALPAGRVSLEELQMLVQRAAQAITLNALVDENAHRLEQQAHGGILTDLLAGRGAAEIALRAEVLALPKVSSYLPLCLATRPVGRSTRSGRLNAQRRTAEFAGQVSQAARSAGLTVIAAPTDDDLIAVLLGIPTRTRSTDLVRVLIARLKAQLATVDSELRFRDQLWRIGIGETAASVTASGESLRAAAHIARVSLSLPANRRADFYTSADIRLRGLLAALREDPRVLAFAESELSALLTHDLDHGSDLEAVLRTFLDLGGNKSVMCQQVGISRPTLYARLATIEKLLGIDLADAESRLCLQVALLVREVRAAAG